MDQPRTAKPVLRVLQGEPVWPPPLWLMRQAGRYLPEYRALRARAGDFLTLCTRPELAAEVTLQPVRRFGLDAAILFSDILIVPWALGQGLEYREGEGPVLPPLRTEASLRALDPGRLAAAIAPILETVARSHAALPDGVTMIGFAGGPFTVACYMVEGSGSKEFAATRTLAYREPLLMDRLIGLLEAATVEYLVAQIRAGAETVMLFDSWAGILSPDLFQRLVVAPTARIVAALGRACPGVPVIGFPRLAATGLGQYARTTGVAGVGVDTGADLAVVAGLLPTGVATQGNLDPMALVVGGEALDRQTDLVLAAARGRAHIFNLGHGIVPQTPPEHVGRLAARVRAGGAAVA